MLTFLITTTPLFFLFFSENLISFSRFFLPFVFFFCWKILLSSTYSLFESFFEFLIIHINHFYIYQKNMFSQLFLMSYFSIFVVFFKKKLFIRNFLSEFSSPEFSTLKFSSSGSSLSVAKEIFIRSVTC